jgi:hypothetical protein
MKKLIWNFIVFGMVTHCSSKETKVTPEVATFFNSQNQTYRVQLSMNSPVKAVEFLEGELIFESLSGLPIEGVAVNSFQPTMPAMGHGTDTTKIAFAESGKGKNHIKVNGIWFNMGGSWEIAITTTISGASDKAIIKVEVP